MVIKEQFIALIMRLYMGVFLVRLGYPVGQWAPSHNLLKSTDAKSVLMLLLW